MCPVALSITKQTVCLFLLCTAFKKGPKHVNSIPLRINSKFSKKIKAYNSRGRDDISHINLLIVNGQFNSLSRVNAAPVSAIFSIIVAPQI